MDLTKHWNPIHEAKRKQEFKAFNSPSQSVRKPPIVHIKKKVKLLGNAFNTHINQRSDPNEWFEKLVKYYSNLSMQ